MNYKTLEQLKKELGGKFDEYMYNTNIELLNKIDKVNDAIDIVIELIKQQPTKDDSWILEKLNGFKYILKETAKRSNR